MEQLNDLYSVEVKKIAAELKIEEREKMSKKDLINEIKKFGEEEEEIASLIEKVTSNSIYICEHGKIKYVCKKCEGTQICTHGKRKYVCKKCKGSQICAHDMVKFRCKECGGSQICEHRKQKQHCKECGGSQICEHGKQKASCKACRMKLLNDLKNKIG